MINVEENLREICRRKGLRLSDVADRMGSGQSNLISSVKGNPSLSKLDEIAKALNVSVSELLTMRPEKATGVAIIDGQVYQVSEPADNVVQMPVYVRYSDLRDDIKEFVAQSIESGVSTSKMAMLETFEVFCLTYDDEGGRFFLSLCFGKGSMLTMGYDKLEFCNWRPEDTEETVEWDLDDITREIINDIEGAVPQILQKQ